MLLCTASPGVQKVLLVAAGIYFWGGADAGVYSKEFAVVYFVSLLSSMGYGATLLKQLPRVNEAAQHKLHRYALGSTAVAAIIFYTLGCFLLSAWKTLEVDFSIPVLLFVVSNSMQQVTRNYFMAKRSYQPLLWFDTLFLMVQIIPAAFLPLDMYFKLISVVSFVSTFVFCFCVSGGISLSIKNICDFESFQFAVNNLVSGGAPVVLPKVISLKYSGEVVAITALYLGGLSFLTIFSRGYMNFKLPELSMAADKSQVFKEKLRAIRSEVQKIIFISILMGVAAYFILDFLFQKVGLLKSYEVSFLIYISILLFVSSGAFGLADSAALFLLGKQRHNIESNLIYFISFLMLCVLFLYEDTYNVSYLLLTLSVLSALRSYYVRFFCEKYLH